MLAGLTQNPESLKRCEGSSPSSGTAALIDRTILHRRALGSCSAAILLQSGQGPASMCVGAGSHSSLVLAVHPERSERSRRALFSRVRARQHPLYSPARRPCGGERRAGHPEAGRLDASLHRYRASARLRPGNPGGGSAARAVCSLRPTATVAGYQQEGARLDIGCPGAPFAVNP